MKLSRGLVSIDQLTQQDAMEISDRAAFYKKRFQLGKDKKVGGLNGLTMINMFLEPSTRTRISFESAAKRMGMLVSNIIADASAMTKGESQVDTIRTLSAMNFDVLVMRTSENNLPYHLSSHMSGAIVNAGDGTNEHPTQALLDYHTMREAGCVGNAKVTIVGNLAHSRVARSNAKLLVKMEYEVALCGPEPWLPDLQDWGLVDEHGKPMVQLYTNLEEAVADAAFVMTLRVQKERFSDTHRGLIDLKEYNEKYGIKNATLKDDQLLLHPGPVNRGVELDDDMVYGKQSLILNQVENGVAVRSAVLEHILRQ